MIHTVFVKCGQVGRVTCLGYLGHSRRFNTQPRAWESCTSLQEASKSNPPLSGKEGGFPISAKAPGNVWYKAVEVGVETILLEGVPPGYGFHEETNVPGTSCLCCILLLSQWPLGIQKTSLAKEVCGIGEQNHLGYPGPRLALRRTSL